MKPSEGGDEEADVELIPHATSDEDETVEDDPRSEPPAAEESSSLCGDHEDWK